MRICFIRTILWYGKSFYSMLHHLSALDVLGAECSVLGHVHGDLEPCENSGSAPVLHRGAVRLLQQAELLHVALLVHRTRAHAALLGRPRRTITCEENKERDISFITFIAHLNRRTLNFVKAY